MMSALGYSRLKVFSVRMSSVRRLKCSATVREKAEFDARQERNMEAFVKNSGLKIVRTKHVKEKEQGRNEKCACNSGKKYKNCCAGKNAESKVAFPNSAK